MTDIVERDEYDLVEHLRKCAARIPDGSAAIYIDYRIVMTEAASEIERLRSALAAEREECAKVAEQIEWVEVEFPIEGVTRPNEPTRKSIASAIRNRK